MSVLDMTEAEILAWSVAIGEADGHKLDWPRWERYRQVEWLKEE